jgi:hypothetical protein
MPIFIHTSNGTARTAIDGPTTRAERTAEAGLGDATARLDDGGSPADVTAAVVTEVKAHIGTHRCRRVRVMVNFGGTQIERRFVPSASVQAVRRWAVGVHGFDLPAAERDEYEVGVCNTGAIADRNVRIGALATRCALCLDLAPRDRFRG